MNVAILGVGMYPEEVGGAQTHAFHVAQGLTRRGHEVTAVIFQRGGDRVTTGESTGPDFRRIRIGIPEALWRAPAEARLAGLRAQLVHAAGEALAKQRPALVHFFRTSPIHQTMLDIVEAAGVPGVFTALGFSAFCARGPLVRPPGVICDGRISPFRCESCMLFRGRDGTEGRGVWTRKALGGVGRVAPALMTAHPQLRSVRRTQRAWRRMLSMNLTAIVPSQVVERTFAENGFPRERMLRLTYGIPEEMTAQRPVRRLSPRLRFTYLGKISSYKGPLIAVEAARLAAAQGARFSLRIFGPLDVAADGYHRALKKAVASTAWPDGVEVSLCGRYRQEELAAIHAGTDALVFTSLWPENATIVVLEALALGTPVIASDAEGVTEFIREGRNGWIYPRGRADALADRMLRLCRRPDELVRAQAGTHCVLTLPQMVDALEQHYDRVTGAGAAVGEVCV